MLLLSRKPGEAVQIGDDVTIKVVETKSGHVKLMFDAPREVPIIRTELLDRQRQTEDRCGEEESGFFTLGA